MSEKRIFIFHHDDMDGRCSAYIVGQYYLENEYDPNDIVHREIAYAKPFDTMDVCYMDIVYFVDYSFTEKTCYILDNVLERALDVIWIDHHKSSFDLMRFYPAYRSIHGLRSTAYSGAWLTYAYLYLNASWSNYEKLVTDTKTYAIGMRVLSYLEGKIPTYIKFVSDYDTFTNKLKETVYFKLGMDSEDTSPTSDIWKKLSSGSNLEQSKEIAKVIKKGEVIKPYVDQTNTIYRDLYAYESLVINGIPEDMSVDIGDNFIFKNSRCLVVNRKSNSWIFGNLFDEYDYTIVFGYNGEEYEYSIFSHLPEYHAVCDKIATYYGGGGHACAAGFKSKELLFTKVSDKKFQISTEAGANFALRIKYNGVIID